MKLITEVPVTPQRPSIDRHSKVVSLGSCFAEQMGEKLAYYQFQVLQNSLGILFNQVRQSDR